MSPNQDRCGRIVVVGRANTGKSTLINALIGQNLHIATARAQTTRYVTSSPLTLGASQFVFIDTPGIYRRQRLQHRQFNRSALSEISSADIVLAVFDGLRFDADDRYLVEKCSECPNALALINKIDTVSNKNRLLPHIELLADTAVFKEVIPISALRGINLDRLIELVEALLPKQSHLMDADALSNRGAVFFIAETIREQALSIYRQEIPHDLRIRVEQAEWRPKVLQIGVAIGVRRSSQKAILLGPQGERLGALRMQSQYALIDRFGEHQKPIQLGLHIQMVQPSKQLEPQFDPYESALDEKARANLQEWFGLKAKLPDA